MICDSTSSPAHKIETTFSGQTAPLTFPIYTGIHGLSTGTQYPPGFSASPSTPTTSSSAEVTLPVTTSTVTSAGSSASEIPTRGVDRNVGAIVGGTVAGVVVICGTVLAIVILLRQQKRKETQTTEQTSREIPAPVTYGEFSMPVMDMGGQRSVGNEMEAPGWGVKHELPGIGERAELSGRR